MVSRVRVQNNGIFPQFFLIIIFFYLFKNIFYLSKFFNTHLA